MNIAVIQCRLFSTRLPHKAILDLNGMPILEHVIRRAKKIRNIDKVIVATTRQKEDRAVADIATSQYCDVIHGSTEDVIERFHTAAIIYKPDYIIRITADNPFTDPEYASIALEKAIDGDYDFYSIRGLPYGVGVGVVKREALEYIYNNAEDKYYREHVTTYFDHYPNDFKIGYSDAGLSPGSDKIRLTIDTQEDFDNAKKIVDMFSNNIINVSTKEIVYSLKNI